MINNLYNNYITLEKLFANPSFLIYCTNPDASTPGQYKLDGYTSAITKNIEYYAGPYKGILTYICKAYSYLNKGDYIYNTNSIDEAKWDQTNKGWVSNVNTQLVVGNNVPENAYVATVNYEIDNEQPAVKFQDINS